MPATLAPSPPSRPAGRFARFAWWATALGGAALAAVGLPLRYRELAVLCAEACADNQLRLSDAPTLSRFGLTVEFYAGYVVALYAAFMLVSAAVALLLRWRRGADSTALLASISLLAQGVTAGLGSATLPEAWDYLNTILLLVWYTSLVNLLYSFPDGRYIPRVARWSWLPWLIWFVLGVVYALSTAQDPPVIFWSVLVGVMVGVFVLGGVAQIYRYRRISTRTQRQQTKLVVAGFAVYIATEIAYSLYSGWLAPALGLPEGGLAPQMIYTLLDVTSLLIVPLAIGAAVLRYRLWDIDLVINRTLVYSVLTALLALAYFASVAVLQNGAALFTGERQSALVTVLSTLLIAALFAPVRTRVQRFIDRRFFRRRYDAARTLAAFGETLKDDVNMEELRGDLLAAVHESMEPEHVSLWVR
jgi:hypothetical protein